MAGRTAKKAASFEDGLNRLEALAEELEAGELALEDLLKRYEEGMKLAAELEKKLGEAQGRMQELREGRDGAPEAMPTDAADQGSLLDMLNE